MTRLMISKTLAALVLACAVQSSLASAPVGTAFNYQGQLKQNGQAVNANADLRFLMYDAAVGGSQVGSLIEAPLTPINNGVFTTSLDFGANVFSGDARWLEIHVRVPAGSGNYATLSPRQPLSATPYAIQALSTSAVPSTALTGTYDNPLTLTNAANVFNGSGAGLVDLNASQLTSGALPNPRLAGAYSNPLSFSNPANSYAGDGSALTNLNASNLAAGIVPSARLAGTYTSALSFANPDNAFVGNGVGLTNLNASNLTSGALPSSALTGTYSNNVNFTNASNSFMGNGSGLENLDASNVATGTLDEARFPSSVLSRLPSEVPGLFPTGMATTGNLPEGLAISGNYAYVVNYGANTLQVFDLSVNPPAAVGSANTGTNPKQIAISGQYAYVVNSGSNTMQVFSLANPTSPALAGSVATAGTPYDVAVAGNYAYVPCYGSSVLQVFNISSPATPTLAGSVGIGTPYAVAVSGNYAYVVSWSGVLIVVNVTTPSSPSVVGSVFVTSQPLNIVVSGTFAFVAGSPLRVVNVANPTSPVVVSTINTNATALAASGNHLYVVDQSARLQVFEISTPTSPSLITSAGTGDYPIGVELAGSRAHVICRASNRLEVFNLAGPGYADTSLALSSASNTLLVTASTGSYGSGAITAVSNGANTMAIYGRANNGSNSIAIKGEATGGGYAGLFLGRSYFNGDTTVGNGDLTISTGDLGLGNSKDVAWGNTRIRGNGGSSGYLEFAVNDSVVQRINANGYVGIGTTTPAEKLDVQFGNIAMDDAYSINWGNTKVRGYNGAAGYIDFTVNGIVGQMISASGNIGVGTSSPANRLHVVGTGLADGAVNVQTSGGRALRVNEWADMSAGTGGMGLFSGNAYLNASNSAYRFASTHGSIGAAGMAVNAPLWNSVAIFANPAPSTAHSTFTPNWIATFLSNGNVGLGTTNPAFRLHLSTDSAAKPGTNTWTISSDRRLKKDVTSLENSLDKLLQLHGVNFRWIDPDSQGGRTGVETRWIAQEVEQVFPEWVGRDGNGFKTLTIGGFEALAVEALRELRAEKDAEIQELKKKNDDLQTRVESLERALQQLLSTKERNR